MKSEMVHNLVAEFLESVAIVVSGKRILIRWITDLIGLLIRVFPDISKHDRKKIASRTWRT